MLEYCVQYKYSEHWIEVPGTRTGIKYAAVSYLNQSLRDDTTMPYRIGVRAPGQWQELDN